MQDKPEGWEDTLRDLIRANFNYENANLAMKKKFGDIGALGGDTYRNLKAKLTGGVDVDEKLEDLKERKRVKKAPSKSKTAWSKGKQSAADGSMLAKIVNAGVYQAMYPMCANKELKEEHVQEINPGGAIVANINYFFPGQQLDHPLVLLGIRIVILYIKFKSVCGMIHSPKKEVLTVGGDKGGLKPGVKTDLRK